MAPQKQRVQPLVIDSELGLQLQREAGEKAIILAADAAGARRALTELSLDYDCIFLNPAVEPPFGVPLIRLALKNRPLIPIFYLSDEPTGPDFEAEVRRFAVRSVIHKPVSFDALARVASGARTGFWLSEPLDGPKGELDAMSDEGFAPVQVRGFIGGARTVFDVYLRLGAGHFVRILEKGDFFSPERIHSHLQKGIHHFYLKKEVQERYLERYDRVTAEVLGRRSAPADRKLEQTANYGAEVSNFLKGRGVDEKTIQAAEKFALKSRQLVERLKLDRNAGVAAFLANLANVEHGAGATILTAVLMDRMGFASMKSTQVVGVAAFLHDVGLPEDLVDEDPRFLPFEQRMRYEEHPRVGAEMLKGFSELNGAVIQVIAQHHERRDRSGFPSQIGFGQIGRVAEVVGVSDELLNLIEAAKRSPGLDIRVEFRSRICERFSNPIVEACARLLGKETLI